MVSGLKIFSITNNEDLNYINSKGFSLARKCGKGGDGCALAIIINYFDNLILAQHTMQNNYKFIEEKYFLLRVSALKLLNKFNEIDTLLMQIKEKNADHDKFAKECRQGGNLLAQIIEFSKVLLPHSSKDTFQTLIPAIEKLSFELNIQAYIYSIIETVKIMKNRYVNPLVISIFQYNTEQNTIKYYSLYHINYKTISIDNLNTSDEFFPIESDISDI